LDFAAFTRKTGEKLKSVFALLLSNFKMEQLGFTLQIFTNSKIRVLF